MCTIKVSTSSKNGKNVNKMPITSMGGTQTDDPLNHHMQLSAWTHEFCLQQKILMQNFQLSEH